MYFKVGVLINSCMFPKFMDVSELVVAIALPSKRVHRVHFAFYEREIRPRMFRESTKRSGQA